MKRKCETLHPEMQKTLPEVYRCTGSLAAVRRTDRYAPKEKRVVLHLCYRCAELFDQMQAELRAEARAS